MTPGQPAAPDEDGAAPLYHAGDEPIPGYRLIEPLGKGGFGEVWKCQAPGGFHKAIKFVQGAASATDDNQRWLAEQEQRAIDFIKNIRHPFLLTVERAELRHGALIIVMELADRSLADLLLDYQGRGVPGIPRAELLAYLAEAAEALDLLSFQHGLQHLDVKPQNLFLVGGHVKVADFGLVNRLAEKEAPQGQGMCGITPRYTAPEALRQRFSRRSDQYSLAIVYQELLTGTLPFKGRTGRQLILQHLQAIPDLAPLPEPDRGPMGRALAKEADERFASCGDLVRALSRLGPAAAPVRSDASILVPPPAETEVTVPQAAAQRTDPVVNLHGRVSLQDFTYQQRIGQTPLGEIWELLSAADERRLAYHLHGFAVETSADQEKALTYLQTIRHAGLLRFKVAETAPHRMVLIFEPWGPSVAERCRQGKLKDAELVRALARAAQTVDELTALTNLEHLALSPDHIVQSTDQEQLRDFGLISLLWKSGTRPIEGLNPRYGAPELAEGRSSPASDQYSLALTYADLRTLQLTGKTIPVPRMAGKAKGGIPLDDVPLPERQVLRKALDANPEKRFATCVELMDALAKAQGGIVSQTTTAVRSAVDAAQQSFLASVDAWLRQQEDERRPGMPSGPAPAGSLRHVAVIEIVPGTAKLRLDVFQQEWQAVPLTATDREFRYLVRLARTFWQRLRGIEVGVNVHVVLDPDPDMPKRTDATVTIAPHHCDAALAQQVMEEMAPALLHSVLQALNSVGERRVARRMPCRSQITVRYRAPGGRPSEVHGEVVDLSRNGIGFVTSEPIDAGVEVRLMLTLPQVSGQPSSVSLKAQVMRCASVADGKYEVGAEFLRELPTA